MSYNVSEKERNKGLRTEIDLLVHVLHEAVSGAEDASLHQLDRLGALVEVVVQHGQLHVRLEWHRPPKQQK